MSQQFGTAVSRRNRLLQMSDSITVLMFLHLCFCNVQMRRCVRLIHIQNSIRLVNGTVVISSKIVNPGMNGSNDEREWIKPFRDLDFLQGFLLPAGRDEVYGVIVMTRRVVRIKLNRAPEALFGARPVPVVQE